MTSLPVLYPPLGVGPIVEVTEVGQSADGPPGLSRRRSLVPEKLFNLSNRAIPSGEISYREGQPLFGRYWTGSFLRTHHCMPC
jgi:hypothetical protein